MAHTRVLHIERGFRMSKNYAEQVMRDHCSIAWVVKGETIRDTTNEERIALRAEQAQKAKLQEPMPYAEIPGYSFDPPASGLAAHRAGFKLIRAAHEFVRAA